MISIDLSCKVIAEEAPDRRKSNEGYRALELPERVLLFLTRLWCKTRFSELGYQYGCGKVSAIRYFEELEVIFHKHFVSRLVFPRDHEELRKMTRKEVLEAFPDLLAILDATNWEQFKPENFLENRLSYSAFKHMTVFQTLLGSHLALLLCWCVFGSCWLILLLCAVVSTERLVLWRSEIFGGISNEISVLLDQSTLPSEMKG